MTDRRHQPTQQVSFGTAYRQPDLFGLAAGSHACHFHHDLVRVRRLAGEVLSHWLADGYASCYVAGFGGRAEVSRQLALPDVADDGGLTLISLDEFHRGGELDLAALWKILRRAIAARGPNPLRLVIESLPVAFDRLYEGEERLNELVTSHPDLSVLCLCDQRALPPHALNRVLELHPELYLERRVRHNPYFDPRLVGRGQEAERAWFERRLGETVRMATGQESVSTSERLGALINASPVAIIALDREAKVTLWCPSAERMFGWSEDEVQGELIPTVPEDKRDEARELLQRVLAGETLTGIELVRQRKDGSPIDVSLSAAPLRTATGRTTGVMALLEDISKRKKAEEVKRRLVAILEATPDVVCTTDVEGRILFINSAGRQLFGLDGEPASKVLLSRIHPLTVARRIRNEAIPAAIAHGTWSGESAVVDRDRREIPVLQVIIAHRDHEGEIEYLSTVIREIADRKRAEEEKAFLAEASRILAGSLDPGQVLDRLAGLVVPRLADFFFIRLESADGGRRSAARHRHLRKQALVDGISQAEWEKSGAQTAPQLVTEVDESWLRTVAAAGDPLEALRALAPRSAIVMPLQWQRYERGLLFLAFAESGRTYDDADLAMTRDLADRAALALENAALYRQAREAVSSRDEVLRIVAHDLRNPLAVIALSSGVLLQNLAPEEESTSRWQLEVIQESVQRADRLIDDLLEVARIEAGLFAVDRQREESLSLLKEAVNLNQPQALEKEIHLEITLPPELPPILADRNRLLQLLGNLLGNAIKFTPAGGTIEVGASATDQEVEFWISDSGPGIPPEDHANLFRAFWQREQGRSGGAGLGLAIASHIIDMHHGSIQVESEEGAGSTFRFTLPRA
jgi:PAS domain S-box-containing protein